MNIQAKVQDIREGVAKLNSLVESLKGLQDAIVPNERISAVMGQTIVPLIANLEAQCARAVTTCEQIAGECQQATRTLCTHTVEDYEALKAKVDEQAEQISDLQEALDTLAQAATRKRRIKT